MNQMEIIQPCENWDEYLLSDVARTTSGGTPDRSKKEFYQGTIPWVKSGELDDSFLDGTEEHISEEGLKKSSAKLFPAGALLMAMYGATVGKTAILKIEAATNQAVCGILPDETKANTEFLRYQLVFFRKKLLSERYGGAQPNISQTIIKSIRLRLPSLPEQRRIAQVLATVQAAIEQQARLIALTRELKSALMHKLFTEGLPVLGRGRGEKQKETEIGLVPESWEVVKIGDVFKFSSGKTRPSDIEENPTLDKPFPVYGGNGVMGYADKYLLEEPTLILGRVGEYCGVAHHTQGKAWISDNALYTKEIKREVNTKYMAEYFTFANLNQYSNKAGQPLITQGIVSAVSMPLPKLDEQEEIYQYFGVLNKKSDLLQSKKTKLEELFRTLLHQLMTGQVRVKEADLTGLEDL